MNEVTEKHQIAELKQMIEEKKEDEPLDKVFAVFCHRHAVSMGKCREYYERLTREKEAEK